MIPTERHEFDDLRRWLLGVAHRCGLGAGRDEDVVDDVLFRALHHPERRKAYLARMVINAAIDAQRHDRTVKIHFDSVSNPWTEDSDVEDPGAELAKAAESVFRLSPNEWPMSERTAQFIKPHLRAGARCAPHLRRALGPNVTAETITQMMDTFIETAVALFTAAGARIPLADHERTRLAAFACAQARLLAVLAKAGTAAPDVACGSLNGDDVDLRLLAGKLTNMVHAWQPGRVDAMEREISFSIEACLLALAGRPLRIEHQAVLAGCADDLLVMGFAAAELRPQIMLPEANKKAIEDLAAWRYREDHGE